MKWMQAWRWVVEVVRAMRTLMVVMAILVVVVTGVNGTKDIDTQYVMEMRPLRGYIKV